MIRDKVIQDLGNIVVCDICNDDYTLSKECGGCCVGSYALCPKCTKSCRHPEEITARCPDGMEFREWVLSLRNGDNRMRIVSADSPDELREYMTRT